MQSNPKPSRPSWLEFALLVAPLPLLAALWDKFPARVPIHWNIRGDIDGWAPKVSGLLFLPAVNALTWSLLRFIEFIDPKIRRTLGDDRVRALWVLRIFRIALLAFMFGVFCFQVAVALGHNIPMDRFIYNGCLLLFIVMGNYFAVLRPNYFVGIRTPWTLENPDTWRATHRIGGRIMVFGALLLIAAEFFIQRQIFAWLFVSYILGFALWALIYSWNYSRTHATIR